MSHSIHSWRAKSANDFFMCAQKNATIPFKDASLVMSDAPSLLLGVSHDADVPSQAGLGATVAGSTWSAREMG